MSEKLTAKQAAEQLLYKPEYAADKSADVKEKAAAFAEGYKAFLNAAKTEREAAAASEKLLTKLDVWREIVAQRASCYHGMEVWDKDSFGHISFDDQSMGFSHLGYIIENAVVHHALWQKAQRCADVTLLAPAVLQQVAWGENEAFLSLQDGSMLTARLVIGADGANSWLRNKADIPLTFWDYHHHALVATIRTAEPHQAVARQAFHGDGILAFLPLSDPHLCSIVWSLSPGEAQRMQQADETIFNQALNIAFDNRLGLCQLASEREVFPLTGRYARQFAAHRLALVGDAAHTIHPLAGQGVNLGYRDVDALLEILAEARGRGEDWASLPVLKRYQARRRADNFIMQSGMDLFYAGFSNDLAPVRMLRNIGLMAAERAGGLKRQALKYALGL